MKSSVKRGTPGESWTRKELIEWLQQNDPSVLEQHSGYLSKGLLVRLCNTAVTSLDLLSRGRVAKLNKPSSGVTLNTRDIDRALAKNMTIDEWLKDEPPITTMWRSFYKVVRWFAYLSHTGAAQDTCVTSLPYQNMTVLTYMLLTIEKKKIRMSLPVGFSQVRKCDPNSIILIDLAIFEDDISDRKNNDRKAVVANEGHANCLVIDLKHKTIERFEPNGEMYPEVDDFLLEHFVKIYYPGFAYVNPLDYIPKHGPQYLQSEKGVSPVAGGFCIAFSFLYFHMRATMHNSSRKTIIKAMMAGGGKAIDLRLRKFLHRVDRIVPNRESKKDLASFDARYFR